MSSLKDTTLVKQMKLLLLEFDIKIVSPQHVCEIAAKSNKCFIEVLLHHLFSEDEIETRRLNKWPRLDSSKIMKMKDIFTLWLQLRNFKSAVISREVAKMKYYIKQELHNNRRARRIHHTNQNTEGPLDTESDDTYEESSTTDDSSDSSGNTNVRFHESAEVYDTDDDC